MGKQENELDIQLVVKPNLHFLLDVLNFQASKVYQARNMETL